MDKIFKIPVNCGLGVYEISGTRTSILSIQYFDNIVTDNSETLKKLKTSSYPAHMIKCFEELADYFQGNLRTFTSKDYINLEGSEFQVKVWRKMMEIPFGTTVSYSELAAMVGSEKAYRSIGTICGKNPCAIVIPCHRVLGKDSIGGFRGGVEKKKILLDFEKKIVAAGGI